MSTPIYTDPPLETLATYLRNWLNAEFTRQYPTVGQAIVKSYRTYDAFNVPYDQYPLLKVYRMFEDCSLEDEKDDVTIVVSYSLVYPELERLSPLIVWVRKEIGNALKTRRITHRTCQPVLTSPRYRAEYRTMLNELTQKVHGFLRITLSAEDYPLP